MRVPACDRDDYREHRHVYEAEGWGLNADRLEVRIGTSIWLTAGLVVAHAGAAALIWIGSPLPWGGALMMPLIAMSLWCTLRRHALRSDAHAVLHVVLEAGDDTPPHAGMQRRDGSRTAGRLDGTTFVSTALVILRLRIPGAWGASSVLMPRDAMTATAHRHLRVWLRWRALPALRRPAAHADGRDRADAPARVEPIPGSQVYGPDDDGAHISERFGQRYTWRLPRDFVRAFLLRLRRIRTRPHERP